MAETNLKEFLLTLNKNYQILREREAKYASAAPLDLLNQIDEYEYAIKLTERATEQDVSLDDLQAEFSGLNLQIDAVVFVAQERPRKPFTGQNPYRGLHKFTEDDADFFFGRNNAIQGLLDTVQYLVDTETSSQEPDFIAVLGASGSGKSSLVRAGLIPALRSNGITGGENWLIKVMLPGPRPLDALAESFIGQVPRGLAAIRSELNDGEKALHYLMVEALSDRPEDAIYVLVIDQFEELFTLCEDESERQAFINQLLYASQVRRNRSFIIVTMRADFYAKVTTYKRLAETITQHQMLVSPLTEKELREAILLPAEAVGLELEKDLVQALVHDTAEAPGALPLLQHALLELFHRKDGNLLTMQAYQEIGGIKGALAHRADSILDDLAPEQQQVTRRIFLRLIQAGEGTVDTRRRATFSEVLTKNNKSTEVEAIVQTLADANLIITNRNPETNEVVLDVSHEALIREWPRLRTWLDEDRQGLRIRQRISLAAQEWLTRGRDEDSLYRGARLLEVEEWVAANPGEINPLEQEFLQAGIEVRERQQAEKEAQRQRELQQAQALAEEQSQRAEEQAKSATRLRRFSVALVVILLLAIVAAVFAFIQQREAKLLTKTAISQKLATQALTRLDKQLDLALLLSLEANRIADTVEAQSSLLAAVEYNPQLIAFLSVHTDTVLSVAFSPDGAYLASGSGDNTVIIWDTAERQPVTVLNGHTAAIRSVAFSPDGAYLASGAEDNTVVIWDIAKSQPVVTLEGHTNWISSLAFSPNGKHLASASFDSTVIMWDVASGQPVTTFTDHAAEVRSVAFSPDGLFLASGSLDQTIILWEVNSGQPIATFEGHTAAIRSIAFSPDGAYLASGSEDNTVIVWDVSTSQPIATLREHNTAVSSVEFSPDGKVLASVDSLGQKIILWEAFAWQPITVLAGHTGEIWDVTFSPDGRYLASGASDKAVIMWNAANYQPNTTLTGHTGWIGRVAFSPDGKYLASGSADQTVIVWDAATGESIKTLKGHTDVIEDLAFSPDGEYLASGSWDQTVIVWNVATGEPIKTLTGHTAQIRGIDFSPDGKYLASGSEDQTIVVWNVETGEPIKTLTGHSDSVRSVAFSPDGTHLASGSKDQTIIIWNLSNGEPVTTLTRHNGTISSVAYSPDGKFLASVGPGENKVTIWDVATEQPIVLSGHTSSVISVDFSPDGTHVASGSLDKTIIVWDIVNKRQRVQNTAHTARVFSVAFSPDGQTLASADEGGTIRLWSIDFGVWQAEACERANRNLTLAEWDQFIGPGIDYEIICPN